MTQEKKAKLQALLKRLLQRLREIEEFLSSGRFEETLEPLKEQEVIRNELARELADLGGRARVEDPELKEVLEEARRACLEAEAKARDGLQVTTKGLQTLQQGTAWKKAQQAFLKKDPRFIDDAR